MADRGVGIPDAPTAATVADVRVRERVIAGATFAEQYVLPISTRVRSGTYRADSGPFVVSSGGDGAGVGRLYLANPSTTLVVALRKVEFMAAPTAATALVSSPRVTVERFSFTGTPTGAAIAAAKLRNLTQNGEVADAAPTARLSTAVTGMTVTAGPVVKSFLVPPILTAVGAAVPVEQDYSPEEDGQIVLGAGEGILVRQADAGTSSDTRKFLVNLAWDEYQLP